MAKSRPGPALTTITRSRRHGRGKTGAALLVALVVLVSGTLLAPRLAGASATAGAVYAWFDNDAGQFCNGAITITGGTNNDSNTPVPTLLATSTAVAAGQSHTLAVDTTGAVYGCGFDGSGQLGNGNTTNTTTPVKAALPAGVVVKAVATGWKTSLALTSTGALYAWGLNDSGEIGDGSTSIHNTPVLVHLPAGVVVTAIAAGQYHCLAVTSTGAVYAWGYNGFGQLGNGGTAQSLLPALVSLPAGVKATSVGAGDNHSLVVTSTGAVYAFGKNTFGQLGNGTTTQSTVPVAVSLPAGAVVTQVAAGGISPTAKVPEGDYSLAVTSTGTVYAWGADAQGQLGNNSTSDSPIPVVTQLPPGANATAVGAGPNFGHALTTDGNIYMWGAKGSGTFKHLVPTATPLPNGLHGAVVSVGPDGEQIAAIMVGSSGAVASLKISPTTSTIAAGGTQAYTVTGYDGMGNNLGDVTGSTGFVVTNGSCTANVCGSSKAGTQTVTATDGVARTTAALTVSPGPVASLVISPATSTAVAGRTQAYTVTGYDGFGNSLGDVTGSTGFVVTNGTCTANVCKSLTAGTQTVTATDGSVTTTAALTVSPGRLASLAITPAASTIAAGATQAYAVTGKDKFGNSIGDVTGSTSFMVTNGSCTANMCGSSTVGTQTVTATDGTATTTAALTISSSPVASLTINPTTSTIAAGGTQKYTITGYDAMNNSLGNVTGSTGFVVTNGSCTANACGSPTAGTQTVTATDGSAQITAALTVTPGPVASLTITPTASTIAAGATQTYTVTGRDGFGNSIGDVTGSTGFMVTNGSCTANMCGSSTIGTQTVTATDGSATTTAALTISSSPVASLTINPITSTIAAGGTQQYTVTGYDAMNNSLGNVTGSTGFVVTNGSCTANVCGSSKAGTQTVTATDGSATTTATLTVSAGPLAKLAITPTTSTINAGATQTYTVTGQDGFGNSLGDVTGSTGFVVTNGTCTANVCGSSKAGTQTVTATDGSATTTAVLTVTPGPVASLTITPTASTIVTGSTQTYTVTGQDGFGNSLGDVTGSTGFVVTNGSCTANVCGSSTVGTQTVTATDGSASTTAALTVSATAFWSAQAIQPNVVTGGGPGAVTLNGQLWTAWRIPTTNQVAIAGYDPNTAVWTAPVIQPVGSSNNSPGIAAMKGKLYVVWTGRGGTANQVAISAYDPAMTSWTTISYDNQALSATSPAVAAFNGKLWVAWKSASSNQIGYASYDPVPGTWSALALHPQAATGNRPALAVVGTFLYLGWTTIGGQIGYSSYDPNSSTWSAQAVQPAASNVKAEPTLTASAGLLYAAWTTSTHTVGYASFNSGTSVWSPMAVHPQAAADHGPALALIGAKLALVWEVRSTNQLAYSFYG